MKDATLFRHAFLTATIVGILARVVMIRVVNKQYPSRPQDYVEQLTLSIIASSLGAIAFPALIDKEYAALTFLAVAVQQFQQVAEQERLTMQNVDNTDLVSRGSMYIEEVSRTYEVRSHLSVFSALSASITFIGLRLYMGMTLWPTVIWSFVAGGITAFLFRKILRRGSIDDIAEVIPATISFDGPLLKVNEVVISNIGLDSSKKRYLEKGLAIEIKPNDSIASGILNDLGQRQAIAHNIYIHMGLDRDVDEPDFIPIPRRSSKNDSIVIPFVPLVKDMDELIKAAKSTPILEQAKGKHQAYSKDEVLTQGK
jgi:uncharacterized protein